MTSIRWKILFAFLLIVGVSYYVVATSLLGLVGDSLFEEREKQETASGARLAMQAAPLLARADSASLQALLEENARDLDARIYVTDASGKVQFDSENEKNGYRLSLPETAGVLLDGKSSVYGVHVEEYAGQDPGWMSLLRRGAEEGTACSATALTKEGGTLGVLVCVTSISDMVRRIGALQDRITLYFMIAAGVCILFALLFSGVITRPIASLTRSIHRMERGDFSARVPVKGSGEFRRLAEAYNSMTEKLEQLDQSRNQFVSNASHELKTPLATMKILLENIIYQPEMDAEMRTEFLTDINKEIDRLNSIIGDLLTLVSMDNKTMRLNRTSFSFAQLVKDTVHRLETVTRKRNQELILQVSDRCDMYADSAKLTQVIDNLVENASKYTQEGGTIRVRLIRSGRDAIFSVSDNGPGIPKEDQAHLFERFYRVDKARSRETGGTGLGLSIVNQIVLMHGGVVSVESEEGSGSTFTVELPIHQG